MAGMSGMVWLTPEQRAAGMTVPTVNYTPQPASGGYVPGNRQGMMRWMVLGLAALVIYLVVKK